MGRAHVAGKRLLAGLLVSALALALVACEGAPGTAGLQGPAGPQGATGQQGPAGPQGATGPEGPAGPKGAAGSQGATGQQGPAGPAVSDAALKAAVATAVADRLPAAKPASAASIARGGRLYDNWMGEKGVPVPAGDHPLWATQSSNLRAGKDTFRCKECHGWDYKGVGGAYGGGSHKTGFAGVYAASQTRTAGQLLDILRGATSYRHNFSANLTDQDLSDLASFISEGLVNMAPYINYATKKPSVAVDAAKGKTLYDATCALCHGADGKQLNFGSAAAPEYVGTLSLDNPWEFLHKVMNGQPGTAMPAGRANGWSIQDALNVLAHTQTLPQ